LVSASLLASSRKEILSVIVGVVLLGTPLRGSPMTAWASIAADLLRVAGFSSHKGIIDDLVHQSPKLLDLLFDFTALANSLKIKVCCFFELFETDYGKRFGLKGIGKGMVRISRTGRCHETLEGLGLSDPTFLGRRRGLRTY
jgi:hypothetical protein